MQEIESIIAYVYNDDIQRVYDTIQSNKNAKKFMGKLLTVKNKAINAKSGDLQVEYYKGVVEGMYDVNFNNRTT